MTDRLWRDLRRSYPCRPSHGDWWNAGEGEEARRKEVGARCVCICAVSVGKKRSGDWLFLERDLIVLVQEVWLLTCSNQLPTPSSSPRGLSCLCLYTPHRNAAGHSRSDHPPSFRYQSPIHTHTHTHTHHLEHPENLFSNMSCDLLCPILAVKVITLYASCLSCHASREGHAPVHVDLHVIVHMVGLGSHTDPHFMSRLGSMALSDVL